MDPRLLDYYNAELVHLREMGAEFAREFPKVAARLGMEGLEVADPYVERLMEGFAFVAARTQLKIDAEYPRFTQHLLEILYPHYLAPFPSCMIVALSPNFGEPALIDGLALPAGARLRSMVPRGEQTACEFRTAHPLTLWPIELTAARYFSFAPDLPLQPLQRGRPVRGGLRLRLRSHAGARFDRLNCDRLDFFINAADEVAGQLYELVHAHGIGAMVVDAAGRPHALPPGCIGELGFEPGEALLPYDRRSFQGYRLLHEYFAFPQRFLFFSITGLRRAFAGVDGNECELVVGFDSANAALEPLIDKDSLSLYATPVINLFSRRADRIEIGEGSHEHHLVVDRARPADFEVFAIQSMRGIGDNLERDIRFQPFYGGSLDPEPADVGAYYTVRREPRLMSTRQRREGARTGYIGSEVFVSLVDEREAPFPLALRQIGSQVLATNRDLPLLLPIGSMNTLMMEDPAPVLGLQMLKGPTRPRSGLVEGEYAWRLLSHLSLNQLSLFSEDADGQKAAAALRELLALYADLSDPATRRAAEAVRRLDARPVIRKLPIAGPITFGRGLAIDLTVSEDAFGGAGGFLFGSVLEKFFARHVAINTFVQTTLLSETRAEVARWPARIGSRPIA